MASPQLYALHVGHSNGYVVSMDRAQSLKKALENLPQGLLVPNGLEHPREVIALAADWIYKSGRASNPVEINAGLCTIVAAAVCRALDQASMAGAFPGDVGLCFGRRGSRFNNEGHVWTFWRGRHYDAVHLDGEDCWTKLLFFEERLRQVERGDRERIRGALLTTFDPLIGRTSPSPPDQSVDYGLTSDEPGEFRGWEDPYHDHSG